MGEIIDLDSYRRQHKRRPVETNVAANRRGQNRRRSERDQVRPAVEPLDRGRGNVDPATVDPGADVEPDDKSTD